MTVATTRDKTRERARRTKSIAEKRKDPTKRGPTASARAAHDDKEVMALKLKPAPLSPAMAELFKLCLEKLGFVPNVFKAFSFDMAKLEGFVGYRNSVMQGESGLSKVEQEMIATAVSTQNRCYYCVTSHGSAVRGLSGDPILGEQIVMNYRAADLDKRQRAMLDFAVKLTADPWAIEEADRAALREAGLNEHDIFDLSETVAFFNLSNRMASATDMMPNREYHTAAR